MDGPGPNEYRSVGPRSQCSLSSAADSRTHPGPADFQLPLMLHSFDSFLGNRSARLP